MLAFGGFNVVSPTVDIYFKSVRVPNFVYYFNILLCGVLNILEDYFVTE